MHPIRRKILDLAKSEVDKVYGGADFGMPGAHWCGLFALRVLHRAGLALDIEWEIGKGFLYRLPQTRQPKPGDLVYFHAHQHHALFVGDWIRFGMIPHVDTIDGNQAGGKVLERRRPARDVAAYYSIEPLLPTIPEL